MYNILIAAGAGIAAFILGFVAAGWVAGFVPALLAFAVAWFLLARRTGKQVEGIVNLAMSAMQGGKIDEARSLLESALPFGKWQVLVGEQIHGQIGAIDYVQAVGLHLQKQYPAAKARFATARDHLEKAWNRDWRAKAVLAALHHREGRPDDAVAVLEKASGPAGGEALFWGLYAFVLNEAKKRDEALKVVGRGLQENKESKPLKDIQEALTNKKRPDFKVLGEGWFQFFPEDIPRERLMEMQGIQQPKGRPPKTWPQPRR